jgi:hypothetical protein
MHTKGLKNIAYSHWSNAYKSLKLINLKFKSCHMMTDWMHIVTGQDAYKMFETYCIVTGQNAYRGLKFINLKFESCHMMADWMHI